LLSQTTGDQIKGQAEAMCLSAKLDDSHYGATGGLNCPSDPQKSCDEKHIDSEAGCFNRSYQADEDSLK